MKLNKSLFVALAAVTTLFAACSEEGYWESGVAQQANTHSFTSASTNYAYTPADVFPDSIPVTIIRGNAGAAETLKVKPTFSDKNLLSGDSLVTFEQGKNSASYFVKVKKANFKIGSKATATLTLDSTAVNVNVGQLSTKISVSLAYTWKAAGKVSFVSEWWENKAVAVNVQKAAEAEGLYRLVDPIYTAVRGTYDKYAPKTGYYLEFYLDANHNAKELPAGVMNVGVMYDATRPAYINWDPATTSFTNKGNVFTLLTSYLVPTASGYGKWGDEKITFTWTEGYPGQK